MVRGAVESDVPGVVCTSNCTTQWDQGSTLGLLATPSKGYRFVQWSGGGCTGNTSCTLTMSAPQTVGAVFGPLRVALHRTVVGRGRIACTPACGLTVAAGGPLILRALPASGWRFVAWAGACRGGVPLCQPKTGTTVSVRARFAKKAKVKKTQRYGSSSGCQLVQLHILNERLVEEAVLHGDAPLREVAANLAR